MKNICLLLLSIIFIGGCSADEPSAEMGKIESIGKTTIKDNRATVNVVFKNKAETITLGKSSDNKWRVIVYRKADTPFSFLE